MKGLKLMTELQKTGEQLANELGYDYMDILEVAAYALTDANAHAEADKVRTIYAQAMDRIPN